MEFASEHIGPETPAGVPSDARLVPVFVDACFEHLRSPTLDVRRAAAKAIGAVFQWRPDLVGQVVISRTDQEHQVANQVRTPLA